MAGAKVGTASTRLCSALRRTLLLAALCAASIFSDPSGAVSVALAADAFAPIPSPLAVEFVDNSLWPRREGRGLPLGLVINVPLIVPAPGPLFVFGISGYSKLLRRNPGRCRGRCGDGKTTRTTTTTTTMAMMAALSDEYNDGKDNTVDEDEPFIAPEKVLFVECGFGNDGHGQSPTKAAVRACRNAIEFNSIPSINRLVPGGYDRLKLDVLLAVPPKYRPGLDLDVIKNVFPYGEVRVTVQDGGMVAPSGIAIDSLGDANDDMVVVCCCVTVGY